MLKRKRERETLHEYMISLPHMYDKWEPESVSNSLCEIYDRLERGRAFSFVFAYSLVCVAIFIINFFRRKA